MLNWLKKDWNGLRVLLFLVWSILVLYGIHEHIFWRDEVRALSIAIKADGFTGLPEILVNEGHPVLWYAFLKLGYNLTHETWVLPFFSFCFAVGFTYLLLFKSKLPLIFSAAIIFGVFGIYDFSIMARNYGISAFFMLLFAHFATKNKPVWAFCMLILTAQTNSYATVFSLFLGTAYFIFELPKTKINISMYIMLISSAILAYLTTMPNNETLVVAPIHLSNIPLDTMWTLGWGFGVMLMGFEPYLGKINLFWSSVLLYASLLLFVRKPWVFLLALAGMVFMSAFQLGIRANFLRHCGVFVFYFITIVWWQYEHIKKTWTLKLTHKLPIIIALTAIGYILSDQLAYGKFFYQSNLYNKTSNAKATGEWLSQNTNKADILIAETDYCMESVVYYHNVDYYLPREKRFNTYSHFTKANKSILTLGEINAIADSFKRMGKNVFYITQWDFNDSLFKDTMSFSYDKLFISNAQSRMNFEKNFTLEKNFNQWYWTDEKYLIYKLK